MKIKVNSAIIVALLVLCGCSTIDVARTDRDLRPKEGEPAGYLLASIGTLSGDNDMNGLHFATVKYQRVGTNDWGRLQFAKVLAKSVISYEDDSKQVSVAMVPLVPGRYEIYDVELSLNRILTAKEQFSIPFEIRENEITYIGEYIVLTVLGENFLGIPGMMGGSFVRSDEFERDRKLAEQLLPDSNAKYTKQTFGVEKPPYIVDYKEKSPR